MDIDSKIIQLITDEKYSDVESLPLGRIDITNYYEIVKNIDDTYFNRLLYFNYMYMDDNDELKALIEDTDKDSMRELFRSNKNFGMFIILNYFEVLKIKHRDANLFKKISSNASKVENKEDELRNIVYRVYTEALENNKDSFTAFEYCKRLILNNEDLLVMLPRLGYSLDKFIENKAKLIKIIYEDTLDYVKDSKNNDHVSIANIIRKKLEDEDPTFPTNTLVASQLVSLFVSTLINKYSSKNDNKKLKKGLYFLES